MSEIGLERRCRRVAHAYADAARADEVMTTLMESNAGRRGPRPGDVVNVLWHGLAARLRNPSPGARLGRLGDAASVAVVTAMVMQTTAAVAIVYRLVRPNHAVIVVKRFGDPHWSPLATYGSNVNALAALAMVFAAGATVAACRAHVRTARALTAATAVTGLGAVVVAQVTGAQATFVSVWAMAAAAVGVVVAGAVLFTGAVPRAVRAVPAWWWGMTAVVCMGVSFRLVDVRYGPGGSGRIGVVQLMYATQVVVLLALSGPLVRTVPQLVTGLAMLLVPATPFLVYGWHGVDGPFASPLYVLLATAVGWSVLAAVVLGTVRLDPGTGAK